jgi:hypothetical protein
MRSLISELLSTYEKYDEFKRKLQNYDNYITGEEGSFVRDVFRTTKLAITVEMFTARFTKLSAGEKDVQQRTFYQLDQMLDFLMAPMKVVNEKTKTMGTYGPQLMGAGKPNPTGKEQ